MKLLNLFALSAFLLVGCSKDEAGDVVDCVGQSLMTKIHATVDAPNPKLYTLGINYSGTHTLKGSVRWDYGDGTAETVNGTTTTHTYKAAGTYTITAAVSLVDPQCTYDVKRTITVN